jgi:chitodextrinase
MKQFDRRFLTFFRPYLLTCSLLVASWCAGTRVDAQTVNLANFNDNPVGSANWNSAVGITFDAAGRLYVWEKAGRVYSYENGSKKLLLDISEEVNSQHDHGLLGLCLDPNYRTNGYLYLYYVVDYHHLTKFGTLAYSAATSDINKATIGRITRYKATASSGFTEVDYGSRKVLLGDRKENGVPITHLSHAGGGIAFGTDGTLLVSFGDGSNFNGADQGSSDGSFWQQALQDSILKQNPAAGINENIGAYRAQLLTCLNGKIVRLNPENGDGLPSNPYYEPGKPRSVRSLIWAYGFRNPFRMSVKPNSGGHNPGEGNPGVLFVGDVGGSIQEELDAVVPGQERNFGWPWFEGMYNRTGWYNTNFKLEQSQARPPFAGYRWGNPQGWSNGIQNIGNPNFQGSCVVGGVFYTGTNFPAEFQNTYFAGDHASGWIRSFELNADYSLKQIRNFRTGIGYVVSITQGPDGALYYLRYSGGANAEIRKVTWGGNRLPLAVAKADKSYGAGPLTVQFNADESSDPDGGALSYEWDFGSGSPKSNQKNPSYTYTATGAQKYTVTLKVTDPQGGSNSTTMVISVNNTPPKINSTSIDGTNTFANGPFTTLNLSANVTDTEHSGAQLSYEWQIILHHDDHTHPEPINTNASTQASLPQVPCDGHIYFYRITLKVTDAAGLSASYQKDIYPNCGQGGDVQPPANPSNLAASNIGPTSLKLSWNAAIDNVGVTGYEIYRDGVVLGTTASTNYDVTGLKAATSYNFNVKAVDAAGNKSTGTNGITVSTSAAPPAGDTQAPTAPANLTSSNVSQTGLTLNWTASTDNVGVTGYEIYRGTDKIGESTTTTFAVTGLTAGTAYGFTVKAKDAAGNVSPASSTHTVTTQATPVTPPPSGCVEQTSYLSDLSWVGTPINAWGPVEKNKSNGEQASGDGRTLTIGGKTYAKGLGVHAGSEITYNLGGSWSRFKAEIGIDDEVPATAPASVVFEVWADGQRLFQSTTLRATASAVALDVDVTGKQQLKLIVTPTGDGNNSDHADWADARLERTCGTQPTGDTQAPTAPANLTSANVSQTGLTLNWSAATDNVSVTTYEVYRGTDKIGESTTTTFAVTGLTAGTAYGFTVKAKDAAGNVSPASSTHTVTTQATPVTPPPSGCVEQTSYLSDLSWVGTPINAWGPVEKNKSNGEQASGDGRALQIRGETYTKGLGVHAASEIVYNLSGTWSRFKADIGIDDEVSNPVASVVFEVWADGQRLFQSATLRRNSPIVGVNVDVTGKQQLKLIVTPTGDGNNSDHADWADARLERTCGTQPTGDTQAPTAPANLTSANVSQTGLTLNWSAATDNVGVTAYEVYRGTVLIGTVSGTSFTVTGLMAGTGYGFTVKAKDAAGNVSPASSTHTVTTQSPAPTGDTQAPTAPANLTSANVSQTGLTLNWSAATDNVGVTGYEVYRGTTLIGTATGTSFTVTGLTAGTAYGFTVKAKDAAGNTSPSSSTHTVTTQATPVTPPPSGCVEQTSYLSDLSWVGTPINAWGPVEKNKSNGEQASGDGRTLTIGGKTYAKGLGVHAGSEITYNLGGSWSRFKAEIGIDDEVPATAPASVVFEVWADGQRLFQSTTLRATASAVALDVDVTGKQQLKLIVTPTGDGNNSDHADWADARLIKTCDNDGGGTPLPPTPTCQPASSYLSDLSWVGTPINAWGPVEKNKSNGEQASGDGRTLTIGGKTYAKGLGVHAGSEITYNLGGSWSRFKAEIGIDDEVPATAPASVVFEVWADGQRLFQSTTLRATASAVALDVDVTGKQQLKLIVTPTGDGNNSDHADWADARLEKTCPPTGSNRTLAVTAPLAVERESAEPVRVYPNPASRRVNVRVTDAYRGAVRLQLLNVLGESVHERMTEKKEETVEHELNVEPLATGVYLLRIHEGSQIRTHRVVVKP